MNRFANEPAFRRGFSCETLEQANAIEKTARKHIGRIGRLDDDPQLLRLVDIEQQMSFGNHAGKQTVMMDFVKVSESSTPVLNWSEIFG